MIITASIQTQHFLGNHSYTKMTIVNGIVVAKDSVLTKINTEDIRKQAHQVAVNLVAETQKSYIEKA